MIRFCTSTCCQCSYLLLLLEQLFNCFVCVCVSVVWKYDKYHSGVDVLTLDSIRYVVVDDVIIHRWFITMRYLHIDRFGCNTWVALHHAMIIMRDPLLRSIRYTRNDEVDIESIFITMNHCRVTIQIDFVVDPSY